MRALCALLLALVASSTLAQAWPSRPIRWIVPFPPGGSNDVSTRPVAEHLSKALSQPVVVENRAGAGGNIGAEFVARSAPDGHTILTGGNWIASAPHLYSKLNFDPLKDFAPVTQLLRQPVLLAAHPSLGVNSVPELVALAKTKPGLGYATSGSGTDQHIAGEWFASLAGIKLTHIPYKGGGQAVTDFIGGQVPLASLGSAPLMPHYKAGKIKLLAQSTQKRARMLPDVPTYEEVGFRGIVLDQWQGVFLPAGTPNNIVLRLNAEIVKALSDTGNRERYAAIAMEAVGSTPEQFSKMLRHDYENYGRLIRDLKIKAD